VSKDAFRDTAHVTNDPALNFCINKKG
jgi:hypothetical protein